MKRSSDSWVISSKKRMIVATCIGIFVGLAGAYLFNKKYQATHESLPLGSDFEDKFRKDCEAKGKTVSITIQANGMRKLECK